MSKNKIILFIFLGIAGFFLLAEHQAHVFGILPFILLLACPLMHIFMHGGHGDHEGHKDNEKEKEKKGGCH